MNPANEYGIKFRKTPCIHKEVVIAIEYAVFGGIGNISMNKIEAIGVAIIDPKIVANIPAFIPSSIDFPKTESEPIN
jgi:hypothetical protein